MLPTEYTKLEYIESSGTQYIDTGFIPNQDSRVVMDAHANISTSAAVSSTYFAFFGCRGNNKYFEIYKAASASWYLYFLCGSVSAYSTSYTSASSYNKRMVIDVNKNVATVDKETLTVAAATWQASYSLMLFATNTNGSAASYIPMKLYSCQIYDNGTLIRDFVPAKNASGTVGLYDAVNGELYANSGSGAFTAGAAVVPGAPSGLAAEATNDGVSLTWNAAANANHYIVLRDGAQLAEVSGGTLLYLDQTAGAGKSYTYQVIAYNGTQSGGAAGITVQTGTIILQIVSAQIAPNPAEINKKITLTVEIKEITIVPKPVYYYAGELYAGEA